jgi:hypothetical protein
MNAVEGASALNAVPALAGGRRRWLILGVIGIAQLMVVLDLTVMNIALPSAQRALNFTTADRQWWSRLTAWRSAVFCWLEESWAI